MSNFLDFLIREASPNSTCGVRRVRFEEGRPRRGNTFLSESRRSIDFRRVGQGRRPPADDLAPLYKNQYSDEAQIRKYFPNEGDPNNDLPNKDHK